MKLVVITRPDFYEGETDICNKLFVSGMQSLHFRKPGASREQLVEWIEGIKPFFRKRIILHDHHDLALQYGLGGVHLNSRNPNVPGWLDRKRLTLSRSCHAIAEVEACQRNFDYVFLSPIFDSISKQGYKSCFSKEELGEAKRRGILYNVYALGGITFENLEEVKDMGFCGAAMLGGFWRAPNSLLGEQLAKL